MVPLRSLPSSSAFGSVWRVPRIAALHSRSPRRTRTKKRAKPRPAPSSISSELPSANALCGRGKRGVPSPPSPPTSRPTDSHLYPHLDLPHTPSTIPPSSSLRSGDLRCRGGGARVTDPVVPFDSISSFTLCYDPEDVEPSQVRADSLPIPSVPWASQLRLLSHAA